MNKRILTAFTSVVLVAFSFGAKAEEIKPRPTPSKYQPCVFAPEPSDKIIAHSLKHKMKLIANMKIGKDERFSLQFWKKENPEDGDNWTVYITNNGKKLTCLVSAGFGGIYHNE